jgi:hypothetical protein
MPVEGITMAINVGATTNVLRPPFEKDGKWYYETTWPVKQHGPFASKAGAVMDIKKAGK